MRDLWQNRRKFCPVFRVKSHFAWRKSATKFLSVKTVSDKVVGPVFAYQSVYKWLVGMSPSTCMRKFGWYWPTPLQNADFQSIFARGALAVTPSKNDTNTKSITRFPMNLKWTSYVALKPPAPPTVAKKRNVSKIWTISCDNYEWYEIGCRLLLVTNRMSHKGFPLIPTSMTLNDLEWP